MAEGKKTFIFYSDWINMIKEMPDKDAGELLKHILSYVNDESPTTDNILVKMAFGHMKPMLKADLDKWDEIRGIRKKAGAKGGKANAKQNKANAKQVEAVNVNVNVNDNVNVNKLVYTEDVHNCLNECLNYFPDHLQPNESGGNSKNIWLDTIDKLKRIDNIPYEHIISIVSKTRKDEFWKKNFLSIPKLRKKDKDGIMYIVRFNEFNINGSKKRNFTKEGIRDYYKSQQ